MCYWIGTLTQRFLTLVWPSLMKRKTPTSAHESLEQCEPSFFLFSSIWSLFVILFFCFICLPNYCPREKKEQILIDLYVSVRCCPESKPEHGSIKSLHIRKVCIWNMILTSPIKCLLGFLYVSCLHLQHNHAYKEIRSYINYQPIFKC
jgi:hypothetical protein